MARNTIKNKELSEEVQEEMSDALEEKVEETEDFLKSIFQNKISTYLVVERTCHLWLFLLY